MLGLILFVVVYTANIQERAGAKLVLLKAAAANMPRLQVVLADDGYSDQPMADYVRKEHGWDFVSVTGTSRLHRTHEANAEQVRLDGRKFSSRVQDAGLNMTSREPGIVPAFGSLQFTFANYATLYVIPKPIEES